MPTGLTRFYGHGDLHFITCSCYDRRPLLGSPARRDLLLPVLEAVRQRYRFVVAAYVVMPEHFHLLVSEPDQGTLSTVMQALKLSFVQQLLGRSPNSGCASNPSSDDGSNHGCPISRAPFAREVGKAPVHIWQRRFYDFNVWTEHKRIEKLRYIHRNPVIRGLLTEPEQWNCERAQLVWYLANV